MLLSLREEHYGDTHNTMRNYSLTISLYHKVLKTRSCTVNMCTLLRETMKGTFSWKRCPRSSLGTYTVFPIHFFRRIIFFFQAGQAMQKQVGWSYTISRRGKSLLFAHARAVEWSFLSVSVVQDPHSASNPRVPSLPIKMVLSQFRLLFTNCRPSSLSP